MVTQASAFEHQNLGEQTRCIVELLLIVRLIRAYCNSASWLQPMSSQTTYHLLTDVGTCSHLKAVLLLV